MTSEAPRSRRARPAKPPLSREVILREARDIARVEGVDGLTMRALAQRLDTGAAALYVYLRNRDEIITTLFDEALAEVPTPKEQCPSWSDELLAFAVAAVDQLARWPGLAASQLGRIPRGPAVFDAVEAVLACLARGGVDIQRAALAADGLMLMIVAHAAELDDATRAPGVLEDQIDATRTAMKGLDEDRHPTIRANIDALLTPSPAQRVHWSLRAFINGVAGTPVPATSKED
ncbi:MAG: TetR family transcriptional regulator [Propionibacteriaceae bacterium]|nr:TetR family transcriptional regulator [Propionibacteriaceae bacterium]